MIKEKFLVPSYYTSFKCKGKSCRKCCCGGWGITLNKKEYYKILNVDCSKKLKDKICAYVTILKDATDERYAKINLNYYGECPLRLENGYCGLQVEVGEEEIPSICRYYPRSPRVFPEKIALISSSCEWLIEELIKDNEPISFKEENLSFNFDKDKDQMIYPSNYKEVINSSIAIISDRKYNFDERINNLAEYLHVNLSSFSIIYLKEVINVISSVYIKNHSIGEYTSNITYDEKITFTEIYNRLLSFFPDLDIYLEKIFTNHFVFMNFPFISLDFNRSDALISLFIIYRYYLVLLYFNLNSSDVNQFVDITSEFFRIAEHSNLYNVAKNVKTYVDCSLVKSNK